MEQLFFYFISGGFLLSFILRIKISKELKYSISPMDYTAAIVIGIMSFMGIILMAIFASVKLEDISKTVLVSFLVAVSVSSFSFWFTSLASKWFSREQKPKYFTELTAMGISSIISAIGSVMELIKLF